jgi:hypothetical protein
MAKRHKPYNLQGHSLLRPSCLDLVTHTAHVITLRHASDFMNMQGFALCQQMLVCHVPQFGEEEAM